MHDPMPPQQFISKKEEEGNAYLNLINIEI
jgi:hypothetical protein